jgi:choline dehydrogenase-like flavoprotein
MNRRKFFFASAATALSLTPALRVSKRLLASTGSQDSLLATHQALFRFWFPLNKLDIAPALKAEVTAIATQVDAAMFAAFQASSLLPLLDGMTEPRLLPFYSNLVTANDPAVRAFLASPGGFGTMPDVYKRPLFSFLFLGTAGLESTQFAMVLREAYLAGIWDLPLAVPLCNIAAPTVFVADPPAWAKEYAPQIPPSRLRYDSDTKTVSHIDGPIEYLVVGSGPAGAVVAHELQRAGKRVVLVEKGSFVVWGSMDTRSYPSLMFEQDTATTVNNSCVVRSGETVGGGTTVNIDLAFSPVTTPNIQKHIDEWIEQGLIDGRFYTQDKLAEAYAWVSSHVPHYHVPQSELNPDNLVLWNGALAYGVQPSRYYLNRYKPGQSPSPVDDKFDAARELLYPAIEHTVNPLSIIPDAEVEEILFTPTPDGNNIKATGVKILTQAPWSTYGNTLIDPCNLQIGDNVEVTIAAENVISCAGTIGSTRLLAATALNNPLANNQQIGKGLIMHPSLPIIGRFETPIDLLDGLNGGVYVDSFAVESGYIFESLTGLPNYGALLIPGTGEQVYNNLSQFNYYAGYGVALIDTPSPTNTISLAEDGSVLINYNLSESDVARFRVGTAIAVRMMFMAGAKQVIVPSNENFLNLPNFDPMIGAYLYNIEQADLVEQNLNFTPNRTFLTAAHLQAANKIGPSPDCAVVSTTQRLWNTAGEEIPNVFVMDSSIFPTSVGANPMQGIYTFAKIFSDRVISGC